MAPVIRFILAEEVKVLKSLGKCPKCDAELKDSDVEEIHFRGIVISHFAYRCNKCGYIIGFGTTFRGLIKEKGKIIFLTP